MTEKLIFDKSLQRIKLIFRLIGLNIDNKERTLTQTFVFLFNLLWHDTDVISAFLWVVFGMFSGKCFTELTHVVPCVIFGILADIKVVFLLFKENKMYILINNLRDLEIRANDFVSTERDKIVEPDIKFLNTIIKVLNVLNFLMFVVFGIVPLLFIAVKYLVTGKFELILLFLDVYPFDSFDPRYRPFTYAHQFWSACIALLDVCAADYFLFICCTHIRLQFKLLQHQFEQIITTKSKHMENSVDEVPVFQDLIKWHQKIINSVNILEDIYTRSTLCNFLASSLMICLTGFNVTTVDDSTVVVTFIVFLSMSMLHVFFMCLFGDIFMSSSTDVATAVYSSKWYVSNTAMRRNLLLVQIRAQRSCKLTASGFADVNLKAYMRILSTDWSYFALLQTVYNLHF